MFKAHGQDPGHWFTKICRKNPWGLMVFRHWLWMTMASLWQVSAILRCRSVVKIWGVYSSLIDLNVISYRQFISIHNKSPLKSMNIYEICEFHDTIDWYPFLDDSPLSDISTFRISTFQSSGAPLPAVHAPLQPRFPGDASGLLISKQWMIKWIWL